MIGNKVNIDHIAHMIKGARILMRVDYNVPVRDGIVTDPKRIHATLPTLRKLFELGAKNVVLLSHRGRPNGVRNFKYSLHPVVPVLEESLSKKIIFMGESYGPEVESACLNASEGSVMLLENLRFHPEEQGSTKDAAGVKIKAEPEKVKNFRKFLGRLGDIYVNDAFGAVHRADSSISGVDIKVRAAGYLVKKELDYFKKALHTPQRPFLVIMGGAKLKDKIPLIYNMLDQVDEMIIGGGLAYTFLKKLENMEIGRSLFDKTACELVPDIMAKAKEKGVKIYLPHDFICSPSSEGNELKHVTSKEGIPTNYEGFDEGDLTKAHYKEIISGAKTVIWNGPLSYFENPKFRNVSYGILEAMMTVTEKGGITIAGGGDTGAFVRTVPGAEDKLSHVSTGGGASLELLEGRKLPGIEWLTNVEDLKKLQSTSY